MAIATSVIIKDLTVVLVLFLIFLLFYSKIKKQSMKEAFIEVKEATTEIVKGDKNG